MAWIKMIPEDEAEGYLAELDERNFTPAALRMVAVGKRRRIAS